MLSQKIYEAFMHESLLRKLTKLMGGAISIFSWILGSLLILENIILVKDTPVGNLFSKNRTDQTNEAFYITQVGCLFSSLTAIGAAAYLLYRLFLQTPYQRIKHDIIEACFATHYSQDLDLSTSNELYRIQQRLLTR